MANKIQCSTHGERDETFVCTHLVGNEAGLGFNREEPSADNPFPDAWCDNCDLIYQAQGGWNEVSEKLIKISLLCSSCYERSRICNTRPAVTLDDLADLRWKCGSCEEWHTGPCLDFGYGSPHYWSDKYDDADSSQTFLNEDFCAIEDRDFFVRGVIHLPIIGAAETFRWGVWGSLSKENFTKLLEMNDDPKRTELPRMFSWMSTKLPEYPDTLSLKMHAHIQEPEMRPHFSLELTEHPLAQQYHRGITPEQVKEIMLNRLKENE